MLPEESVEEDIAGGVMYRSNGTGFGEEIAVEYLVVVALGLRLKRRRACI